jgi:hypothetical protein
MSQPLIVSVPHRLGRQEATRRLESGIGQLQGELGAILRGLDHHWQGDTLNFIASATMGDAAPPDTIAKRVRAPRRAARKAARRGVGNCLSRGYRGDRVVVCGEGSHWA